MKAIGIIAEYNPFHKGHAYQIQKAKKQSGADVVVVCMSGNFLQRGEPAIIDKWKRASYALDHGVDLVVELPFKYAVQPADIFASAGVQILSDLSCEALSFGFESGEASQFDKLADYLLDHEEAIDKKIRTSSKQALSYPEKFSLLIEGSLRDEEKDAASAFQKPNNLLGLLYTKAAKEFSPSMAIYPVKRLGSQHGDVNLKTDDHYASGTAIRQALLNQQAESVRPYLHHQVWQDLRSSFLMDWQQAWPYLNYQITCQTEQSLRSIYQMTEGLEYRLKRSIKQADSFKALMEVIKTRRYTWTRLQRLLTYVLVQARVEDMEVLNNEKPSYLRVLGFTPKGRAYLSEIKNKTKRPLISKIEKKRPPALDLDIRAGEVYRLLGKGRVLNQDFQRFPVMTNKADGK